MKFIKQSFAWLLPAFSGLLAFTIALGCLATPAQALTEDISGTIYPKLTKFQKFRYKQPAVGIWINPNTSHREGNWNFYYRDVSFSKNCYWALGLRDRKGNQKTRLEFYKNNPPKTLFPHTIGNTAGYDFAFNGRIEPTCGAMMLSAKFTATLTGHGKARGK